MHADREESSPFPDGLRMRVPRRLRVGTLGLSRAFADEGEGEGDHEGEDAVASQAAYGTSVMWDLGGVVVRRSVDRGFRYRPLVSASPCHDRPGSTSDHSPQLADRPARTRGARHCLIKRPYERFA